MQTQLQEQNNHTQNDRRGMYMLQAVWNEAWINAITTNNHK